MTWAWEPWLLQDEEVKPALALAMALRRAPMGVLLLRDADSGSMKMVLSSGLTGDASTLFNEQGTTLAQIGAACSEHRRVYIRDARKDVVDGIERIRELAQGMGFRGMEVLPLERDNLTAIGALTLFFRSPLRVAPRSERLMDLAVMLIALALDNARLRAEEARRRKVAEQRAYDRLQFLARINHELRTPLQSITGYLELLQDDGDPPTERQRDILEHIEHSEQVLLNIIDSVANLGRIEAGRMTYTITGVTVPDVLARVASVVAPLARKQGVDLQVDTAPRDLLAHGDRGKITQILINLVTNAIKFTPARGVVMLSTRRVGSRVDFVVTDEGPGIPPDKLTAIFEPYIQFDQRRHSPLTGFGLGLAISREFAEGMGGTLVAENAPPPATGAMFTFSIRAHRADRPAWRTRPQPPLSATVSVPHALIMAQVADALVQPSSPPGDAATSSAPPS